MAGNPKFAHVVFQIAQPQEMRDWYCTVLDGHAVYADDNHSFITFDEEHHRVTLIYPPVPLECTAPSTAAMHHVACTFGTGYELLGRYVLLRDQGISPAVVIDHGVTTSMCYRDPDGNMVETQIDRFAEPAAATAYMNGPEYASDSAGPAFDPEELLKARRNGATVSELSDRAWALRSNLPDPMPILMGALS